MEDERLIALGGEIKALADGKIGGYLVRFTDPDRPDLEGEYFTKSTDFDIEPGDRATIYFHHGLDPVLGAAKIGKGTLSVDDVGVWIEGWLDTRNQYEAYVARIRADLIAAGKAGWSSGTIPSLVQKERNGKAVWIKSWPIGKDATITPIPAAGPEDTRVINLKFYTDLFSSESDETANPESAQESTSEAVADATKTASKSNLEKPEQPAEVETMSEMEKPEAKEAPALTIEQIGEAMKAALGPINARLEKLEAEPVNPAGVAKSVNVVTDTEHWRYDNVSGGDLAFMIGVLERAKATGKSRNGASPAAFKALAHRLESDEARKSEPLAIAGRAMKAAGVKANEINQSTLANYGDEWVGVAYSGQLWDSIRHEAMILNRLPSMEVPGGAESVVIPLESTDPTWYKVAQAASLGSNPGGVPTNTVTASNLGTASQSLTLAKMGARVLWTGELEEDAVLPYVAQLNRQLAVSGAEYLESAIIDGDTETGATTNINDIADTPGGTEYWLTVNGFRKLALVTNTANARDAGSLTSSDFLETVKLMGVGGANAADVTRTAFIIPYAVHYKALELADVKTRDVFNGATIESGRLTGIFGYPIYVSHHMHKAQASRLANTAGKIDLNTAGNNTKSAILAVRFDQWMFGWRRRMTLETTRFAAADSTEIVAMMRFGLVYRDTEASAISYNVTV